MSMDNLTKTLLTIAAHGADAVRPGAGDCVREKIACEEFEADDLLPLPLTYSPDVVSVGAQADWLATEHVRIGGQKDDEYEHMRLCKAYRAKLEAAAEQALEVAMIEVMVDDEEDDDEPIRVKCSYPNCDRLTTRDPIYDDLCYEHCRCESE
jgi:hypothetical protein